MGGGCLFGRRNINSDRTNVRHHIRGTLVKSIINKRILTLSAALAASSLLIACSGEGANDGLANLNSVVEELPTLDSALAGTPIEDQYIVVLDKLPSSKALGLPLVGTLVSDIAEQLATDHGLTLGPVFENALTGFVAQMTPQQVTDLLAVPGVSYIEQDTIVSGTATQNNATWGLDRIDQANRPLDGTYNYNLDGQGVHAYIIDTGIRTTHNEFTGRMGNSRNFVSSGGGLFNTGSVDPDNFEDCQGHGSHVAGTVAGTTYGVAKQATLHAVRVLGCTGNGTNSGVINGVDWVMANHIKPAVANMSLGGGNSTALDQAVQNAINAGVHMVVAAGNDDTNACNGSPNRVAEALTVGSTTNSDVRSSFSNHGACVDIFAPGSSITSAGINNDNSTATMSGTSMAAPHVAGVVALYLAANPNADTDEVFDQVLALGTSNKLASIESGSPNLLLQNQVSGDGTPIDNLPVARLTANCDELACTFNASTSSDDNGITAYSWNFGDGQTATGVSTSHSYSAAGSYTVTLTVTDTTAQTDDATQTVSVAEAGAGPCPTCEQSSGTLSNGQTVYTDSFNGGSGTYEGYLVGAAGTDFDLRLEKFTQSCFIFCSSSWNSVATAENAGSNEEINYSGTAGQYRWRISSYSGAGSYDFYSKAP